MQWLAGPSSWKCLQWVYRARRLYHWHHQTKFAPAVLWNACSLKYAEFSPLHFYIWDFMFITLNYLTPKWEISKTPLKSCECDPFVNYALSGSLWASYLLLKFQLTFKDLILFLRQQRMCFTPEMTKWGIYANEQHVKVLDKQSVSPGDLITRMWSSIFLLSQACPTCYS